MLPTELAESLKLLSDEIIAYRLVPTTASDFDPAPYLAQAATLFAALHAVNRETLLFTKRCKGKTQDARLAMDSAHLRLQNLKFEQNHLEREIRKCEEFESQFQLLPLLPVDDLLQLASSDPPPPGLPVPLPRDEHELMLARLQFELAERKRLDEEKKSLGQEKTKLVRENEVKKGRLEELEKQLEEFVTSARSIQTKMQAE